MTSGLRSFAERRASTTGPAVVFSNKLGGARGATADEPNRPLNVSVCTCARCARKVERPRGPIGFRALYAAAWLLLLPYLVMSACSGLGIFMFAPLTMVLGLGIGALLGPYAFPRELCPNCGASLAYATPG